MGTLIHQTEPTANASDVSGLGKIFNCLQKGGGRADRVLGNFKAEELYLLLTKDKFLLVEDDAVGGTQGQVGTGPEEVLLQGLVPEESVIHTFGEVSKPSDDLIVSAGVPISGRQETLGGGFVLVAAK